MFYYLLLSVILSSPSDLLKRAAESIGQSDLPLAQQYIDSAKDGQLTDFERSKLFYSQAYIDLEQNRPAEALLQYHESLRYLKSSGDDSDDARYMLTWVNSNIARIYYYYSNHDLALKYYEEAMKHATYSEKAELLYNKSFPQTSLGNTEEAINSLLESFKICVDQEINNVERDVASRIEILQQKANVQIELGVLFLNDEKYQAAEEYLGQVIINDTLPEHTLAYAHNNYAINKWGTGDYEAAKIHFEKTIQFGDSSFQFIAYQNLSELYLEQNHLQKSIEAGIMAEKLLKTENLEPNNLILYSYLSEAYEGLGDKESALQYARLFNEHMISYYQEEENSIDVEQANRIKMITENYELRVEQLQERKITILINVLISSLILCTLLLLIWRQQTKKKKMVREITEELLA